MNTKRHIGKRILINACKQLDIPLVCCVLHTGYGMFGDKCFGMVFSNPEHANKLVEHDERLVSDEYYGRYIVYAQNFTEY